MPAADRVPMLPTLLPSQLQIQGFLQLPLRFNNLLVGFTGLRNTDVYQFLIQDTTQKRLNGDNE